jgi:hypothetical protein
MSEINNSLSSITENLIKLQRNNSEILTKLSEVVNSDSDTVTFTIEDISNNNIKTISIPSFGSMKKEIERLDETLKQTLSLNESDASVKLADGTYRTIIKSSLKKSADDLIKVQPPINFASKSNWFFESMMNPFLYVGLLFPGQMDPNTERVKMQKFILNLDSDNKLNIFNEQIKNNPNLSYPDFIDLINNNAIKYTLDDDILELPPVEPRYYGNFSVLRVFEDSTDILVNGLISKKKSLKYQLDKLNYNDKNSSTFETQQLKVGDSLLVNKNNKNTRYGIDSIDFETNTISVSLLEGYDSVNIGSEILSYYPTENIVPEIRVGIGYNEYLAIFLKPINPESNRPANNFSPCISFYTSELLIKDTDNIIKSLNTYYQEKVVDFGAILFSMAKENIPPSSKAIEPFAPILNQSDFKVVQINKHTTDGQSNETLKSLNKEKNTLKSELTELDNSILSKRKEISTKTYKSDTERDTDNNKLVSLISKRSATETLYNSTINDILSKAQDKTTSTSSAKYRLRGFWNFPQKQTSLDGTEQEIIQFKIEYRYLTKGGSPNNLEEFTISETNTKGVYSNWICLKTDIRERKLNTTTGTYYWVEQDVQNGEQVNINQLDLPINFNETVEFRIKSISEAGYPTNPAESQWSDIIKIDFPDDLGISKEILDIIKETNNEKVKVSLNEDLTQKGVYSHIDDQFTQNNFAWKHQSFNIASGFLSDERNVISLFDYLKSLQDKISSLEAQINKTFGVLLIKLEDENGNQKIIQENSTISIFAGNYKDLVSSLDKPKGTIITKNYFIRIENDAATTLELMSGVNSTFAGSKFQKTQGIYSAPSIGISNPSVEDLSNSEKTAFNLPYQSSQVQGQFMYIREKDITSTKTIYAELNGGLQNNYYKFDPTLITGATGNYKTDNDYFVWTGTQTDSNTIECIKPPVFSENVVYIHGEHPDLQDAIIQDAKWINDNSTISIFANKKFGADSTYYQQSRFLTANVNDIDISNKMSFKENDKYLLGPASCGCYLYLSSLTYEDIRVNGNDSSSVKKLENGSKNALVFQLVYQFRMTDYFGPGTDGVGRIGGQDGITQLEYRKLIGLDVFYDNKKFSFDIEFTSRYKSNSIGNSDVPFGIFQNTFNQTTNALNQITPNIN